MRFGALSSRPLARPLAPGNLGSAFVRLAAREGVGEDGVFEWLNGSIGRFGLRLTFAVRAGTIFVEG